MNLINLASCNKYDIGIVRQIDESQIPHKAGLVSGEVEARLLEMGFIEGARLQVLHLGVWGKDPIAVRINNSNSIIALRKNEASTILLEKINHE
jgi:ferrous iron transport protein A